jgi:hypothetical protein
VISISEHRVYCTAYPDVLVEVAGGGEAPAAKCAPVRRTMDGGRGQGLRLSTALVKAFTAALLQLTFFSVLTFDLYIFLVYDFCEMSRLKENKLPQ